MAVRVVEPRGKGALLLDARPGGCRATVEQAAAEVTADAAPDGPAPTVLIIGTGSGYGQAITTAGLVGMRISGIGLCLERAATGRRTASAGWYRARATAALAQRHGPRFDLHNGDCYAPDTKRTILRRLAEKYGDAPVGDQADRGGAHHPLEATGTGSPRPPSRGRRERG